MYKAKLTAILTVLFVAQAAIGSETRKLEAGLLIGPVVDKIADQNKPSWLRSWFKPAEPKCVAKIIAVNFLIHDLHSPVLFNMSDKYTPAELLKELDTCICKALVMEEKRLGLSFNHCSESDIQKFNAIKKQYYDALPAILQRAYGKSADVYVKGIDEARAAYESSHGGLLVGLR